LRQANSTANKPPVCSWREPAAVLLEKSAEELLHARPETISNSGEGLPKWAVGAIAAAFTAVAMYVSQSAL